MRDFSATRRWWPECLVDEVMPEGRTSPEAWLKPGADGVTAFLWDDEEAEQRVVATAAPGSTVAFLWYEDRGRVRVRIIADGSWSFDGDGRAAGVPDLFTGEVMAELPAARVEDATHFFIAGDWETCADSMDELARNFADFDPPGPEGATVEVWMGCWSAEEAFLVSTDGKSLTRAST